MCPNKGSAQSIFFLFTYFGEDCITSGNVSNFEFPRDLSRTRKWRAQIRHYKLYSSLDLCLHMGGNSRMSSSIYTGYPNHMKAYQSNKLPPNIGPNGPLSWKLKCIRSRWKAFTKYILFHSKFERSVSTWLCLNEILDTMKLAKLVHVCST